MELQSRPNAVGGEVISFAAMVERDRAQRLWRLRKLHDYVDAEIKEGGGEGAIEVHFFFNGAFSYSRQLATRALAVAEASAKRTELEREGWMFHW